MQTFIKEKLSASNGGRGIIINATGSPGTTVHNAVSGTAMDSVWLYITNNHSVPIDVTVQWGDLVARNNIIYTGLNPNQQFLASPGLTLGGQNVIRVFSSVSGVSSAFGHVTKVL